MSKKSSKTSHVLNLLTNRTGAVMDDIDTEEVPERNESTAMEDSAPQSSDKSEPISSTSDLSGAIPQQHANSAATVTEVEIAKPVRISVTNPIIAQLTREEGHTSSAIEPFIGISEEAAAPTKPVIPPPSVSDLIKDALEETYEEELKNQPEVKTYTPEEFPDPSEAQYSSHINIEGDMNLNEIEQQPESIEAISVDEIETIPNTIPETGEHVFDYGYVNVMEEIIKYNAVPLMESLGVCMCERCVNDVIAMALNQIPPKYVVTEKGTLFTKASAYESQHSIDILSAITKACMQVKNTPRHDK